MVNENEMVGVEPLFARARGDVWHRVAPAAGKGWLLQCTGHAARLDEPEDHGLREPPLSTGGKEPPIELHLCEVCLRSLK